MITIFGHCSMPTQHLLVRQRDLDFAVKPPWPHESRVKRVRPA